MRTGSNRSRDYAKGLHQDHQVPGAYRRQGYRGPGRDGGDYSGPGTATRNARYAITLPRQSQDAGCSEPSDRAQALFQSTDTDGRLYPANPSIRYDGPIVAADGWYAIQRVASQTFVAHSVQALDDSPQVGAVVSIHHGHIIAPERQETRGMNKKRKPTT
ncbi:KfrB domain-containing protein [Thiolapillus sp.]|uniref:KfrB domain-containing protein n=2 Tax=Thiolapillus sp. TaxID=2017437 RepID=UPI003AF93883